MGRNGDAKVLVLVGAGLTGSVLSIGFGAHGLRFTLENMLTVYVFLYGKAYLALSGLDIAITDKASRIGNRLYVYKWV